MKRNYTILIAALLINLNVWSQQAETAFDRLVKTEFIYMAFYPMTFQDDVNDYFPFFPKQAGKDFYSPTSGDNLQVLNDYYGMSEFVLNSDKYWVKDIYDQIPITFLPSLKEYTNPVKIKIYNNVSEVAEYYYENISEEGDFTFHRAFLASDKSREWHFVNNNLIEINSFKDDRLISKTKNKYAADKLIEKQILNMRNDNFHKVNYTYQDGQLVKREIFELKDNKKYKLKKRFEFTTDEQQGSNNVLQVYLNNDKQKSQLFYNRNDQGRVDIMNRTNESEITNSIVYYTYDKDGKLSGKTFFINNSQIRTIQYFYMDNGLIKEMKIVNTSVSGDKEYRIKLYYYPDKKLNSIERFFVRADNNNDLKEYVMFYYNEKGNIEKIRRNFGTLRPQILITLEYYPTLK